VDYFAMFDTARESDADRDFGSGGSIVLPNMTDARGSVRHLAIGAGKDGNIYLVDRDDMGKFNPQNDDAIYQELQGALPGGIWSMPAYYSGRVYFGAVGSPIRAFQFSKAKLSATAVSSTNTVFPYPGATPSISANLTANALLWAVENSPNAVLHAYSAENLKQELYNSNQAANGRDQFGAGNKFMVPTIANGKVYVGTPNGVAAFGLLNSH
jgi:outer membrane protein assembly factor BamB